VFSEHVSAGFGRKRKVLLLGVFQTCFVDVFGDGGIALVMDWDVPIEAQPSVEFILVAFGTAEKYAITCWIDFGEIDKEVAGKQRNLRSSIISYMNLFKLDSAVEQALRGKLATNLATNLRLTCD